ncbi:hypothetical protein H8D83_00695 [Candidatus Woesearchaeota archaeon]|nr:hypothetical protein [Candidatus Woesearchaeota archaeon]
MFCETFLNPSKLHIIEDKMDKIKQKINDGWLHCNFIIEMLGKPKEHLEKTLKGYIELLKKDKTIEILKEDYVEPEEKEGLFTMFVELETLMKDTKRVVEFCFDYMPSSVEIIEPANLTYSSHDFSDILNDLQARLHKIDMVAKNTGQENKILRKNSAIFLRNLIFLALKEKGKDVVELSKNTGVPEKELEKFMDILIKEKKIKKQKKIYSLN